MALNSLTTGSPFDGFFSKHIPQFFFEKFSGNDAQRIEALFNNLDIIFDNIYQKIKDFPNQIDIRNAQVEYLYELAQLIGLTEIENLSKYLDSNGNVNTSILTQTQYDNLLIQQKTYIANTLVRLLLKGTSESIIKILQSHGITASIRELWAEDTINGPYFEYDNDLVTKYGNATTGSISGDVYTEEQPIDIITEILNDISFIDIITWAARSASENNNWFSVTYGNGLFVAVSINGTNQVMTSSDGITWTARSAAEANIWVSITYGNGLFVAVSQDGTNRVMTSPDGITWTARSAAEANIWQSVTYGNGLFVAVSIDGTNRVMTSPDGITWTSRSASEANNWQSITWSSDLNLFVAIAYSGTNKVMTSPDGITWTARSAAEANSWQSVTYGNGLFVAVSQDGTNRVMTSPDGITWTARSASEANIWISVTYGNGLFVAVATSGTNRVMTSPDGITWTARSAAEANIWQSVTYGNGLFVAVSYDGTNRVMSLTYKLLDILQYEQNKYGYKYILDNNYNLYYKTSTIVSLSSTSEDTWYYYDNSVLSISGDIVEFKLLKDKIYLRTNINDLAILDYQLDDLSITPDFSIDNNDCLFIDFIEDNDYVFLDRNSTIEIRNTTNFQRIANAITKPISGTDEINQIIYKEDKEYLLINDNKKGYILNVDILAETYNLNTPEIVYDLLIDTNENFYKAFRIADNEFTILKYDDTLNILKASYLYFDDNDILSSSSLIISNNFTEINDFYQYNQNILILGNTKLGIYNIKQKTINEYDYVTTGYNYKQVFLLDKFYFKRFLDTDLDLTKILGWNSFKEYLFKSHYFDLTVGVDFLTDIIDIGVTSANLKAFINEIVDLAKPIHTEFNLIAILTGAIEEESISIGNDTLTETPIISGGPTYILSMTAKYDGIHPWKRSNNHQIKYNSDGQQIDLSVWLSQSTPGTNTWQSVTYGNGLYVAVAAFGSNRVMTSPDGITWTARSAAEANSWQSVTYGNGLFVAVSITGTNRVMTSPDGITWTARSAAASNQWYSVTYGNGLFVAVSIDGTNRVMTSPDGITWTSRSAAENNFWLSITYGNGNGLFVAVASSGTNKVMTSPDGITWTSRSAAEANTWQSVTYGNNLYVAVSIDGTNRVMTSPDGITWTARSASEANSWQSITYGNCNFVAISQDGTNRIMTSSDGITWTSRSAAEANLWQSITYGNGLFVAVSESGANRAMISLQARTKLTYGPTPFNFGANNTNTELDDLIYYNSELT